MSEKKKVSWLPPNVVGGMQRNGVFNMSPSSQERRQVIEYLQQVQVEGMRKHLCLSCAFSTLYDKNNQPYKISRHNTLAQVKHIVETIRTVNLS